MELQNNMLSPLNAVSDTNDEQKGAALVGFGGTKVSEYLKKQALKSLFKQAEFNELDYLNEYDEDYTTFPKLGGVVTQEMKRMLKLAEEKTRPESNDVEDNKLLAEEDGISQQLDSDEDDKLA